ncbi:MAG: acetate--CoA ligase [Omnitrophica WOR_2 bacterium RIFCSPLOWO2_12_FULL_50_9]|nr:MAG: acetate--CoA ligase [Omnitrophica WOR_2 bacterium RIFCSPLOWO2_12_FULL_50_9]
MTKQNNTTAVKQETVHVFLKEHRVFRPSEEFRRHALIKDETIYKEAERDREAFWAKWAGQLDWYKKWDKVLEWKLPFAKWFVGGKLNASFNCLDRHIEKGLGRKTAIIWEGEPGEQRILTYEDMYKAVNKLADVLKSLGVKKGDRVAVYMPMIPEIVMAMLACARIGAVHTVVFGGFSAEALKDRIHDAKAKLLITADGGYRRGKVILLKETADEAVSASPCIQHVIVVKRAGNDVSMQNGRDLWFHELMSKAKEHCEPEEMDAEDILYILYTSGTTGKPKGIIHTTGGYMTCVAATTQWVFDLKPADIFWCTADIGWVTGHSYIVYGPMANAATQVMYEGSPDYPERNRFWKIIEKHKVTVFYTAPTAIRTFMKWGTPWPDGCDLSSLRLLGSVGEPINPEAWIWYYQHIGKERCPVVDTWWQTETGSILISPLPGVTALKPGSAAKPLPGIEAAVVTQDGETVREGGGYLAIQSPWPSMLRGIYGDEERYKATYWSKWKGVYFPADGAKIDADGYFWLLGRVDDIMLVAGHNISTMEVESALVDHPTVAESAVVGITDEVKGQAIAAFVTLKEGNAPGPQIEETLKGHVAHKIGPIARPQKIIFTAELPKTRSGKIMRRLLRDIAEGRALGDVTTLADVHVVEALKEKYQEEG